ncbi:MAG TPA: glycogen synthase [Candidatus Aminicenantes bacterium]|nr:glycogen synthase [Candidatus Aminicenantes bacterium]
MKVAIYASEVIPYAKTGGLADVAGALPAYLNKLGIESILFMPLYREVRRKNLPLKKIIEKGEFEWAGSLGREARGDHSSPAGRSARTSYEKASFSLWEHDAGSFRACFVENDAYFDRDFLYGTPAGDYPDNGERFGFFSRAALESLKILDFRPHILHCHDWQSAMALAYLQFIYPNDPFFREVRSLFTIHNLAYQGLFDKSILPTIGLPESLFNMNDLEFYGKVNFLKAGILYSTAVSTVSPRYSREIQTPEMGFGLDGLLRSRSSVLHGVLNGVDYDHWNPRTDTLIPANFGPGDLGGKQVCKKGLLEAFQLPDSPSPVVGMVSRLAGQKGLDIVCEALKGIFALGVKLVVLGTGEEKIHELLKEAQKDYPDQLGLKIAFDERLAHMIYAGSDIFLIPSRYEPCGLTQMYSLKYGTIPVVRATGGLDDSIREFDPGTQSGNGFKFEDYSAVALTGSLKKAVDLVRQPRIWGALVRNAMACDFSWERAAGNYVELFKKISSPSSS